MNKTFYRVCNPETEQGLWYNFDGSFSGLIHNEFDFCVNSQLKMDFDPELIGWLSATDSLEDLYKWFSISDIINLQNKGWFLHAYEVTECKFYDKFQHFVICQKTSRLISKYIFLSEKHIRIEKVVNI